MAFTRSLLLIEEFCLAASRSANRKRREVKSKEINRSQSVLLLLDLQKGSETLPSGCQEIL